MIRLRDILRLNEQEQQTQLKVVTDEQFISAMPPSKYPDELSQCFSKSSELSRNVLREIASSNLQTVKTEFINSFNEFADKHKNKDLKNIRVRAKKGSTSDTKRIDGTNIILDINLNALFQDDSAELNSAELEQILKTAIDDLYKVNPDSTIGLASYEIIATTSKVPSTKYANAGGNDKLAQDRSNAIKSSVNDILPTTQLVGTLNDVQGTEELGERGPEYDRAKFSLDKRNADPNVKAEYENIYGPHRQSRIILVIDIIPVPTQKKRTVTNYTWQFYITSATKPKPQYPNKLRRGAGVFKPRTSGYTPCPLF